MKTKHKRLLWIIAPLSVVMCCLLLFMWLKSSVSSGEPQGKCSVKALLLDKSNFPPKTTMSFSEDFGDAVAAASHNFGNLDRGIDFYQAVEYYNAPFVVWQVYAYHSNIFKKTKYNDSWREPDEITFSSQTANQHRFACTNDTVVGHICILHARYGRYFVLVSATLSQEFTIRDLVPLLQEIDARMSPCNHK